MTGDADTDAIDADERICGESVGEQLACEAAAAAADVASDDESSRIDVLGADEYEARWWLPEPGACFCVIGCCASSSGDSVAMNAVGAAHSRRVTPGRFNVRLDISCKRLFCERAGTRLVNVQDDGCADRAYDAR